MPTDVLSDPRERTIRLYSNGLATGVGLRRPFRYDGAAIEVTRWLLSDHGLRWIDDLGVPDTYLEQRLWESVDVLDTHDVRRVIDWLTSPAGEEWLIGLLRCVTDRPRWMVYVRCDPRHSEYGFYLVDVPSEARARRWRTHLRRCGALAHAGRPIPGEWRDEIDLPDGNVIAAAIEIADAQVWRVDVLP